MSRQVNENALYRIEIENQVQLNSRISYQLMELKKKEALFTSIITEAKKHQEKFEENFEEAKEFLNSQPLVELLNQQYPTPIDPFCKKTDQELYNFVEPEFDADGKPIKSKKKKKAPTLSDDICSFSGVTNQLNEIMTHLGQIAASPPAMASSQSVANDITFEEFEQRLIANVGGIQQQTALKLLARLKKPEIIKADAEIQVGETEVNAALQENIRLMD